MANPMMASQGRGQRIGLGWSIRLAALLVLGLGGVPGSARACHIHHAKSSTGAQSVSPTGSSTVHSAQILNPTSMVPRIPPLIPTSAPTITPTSATAPTASGSSNPIVPSPLANPPAAEQIAPLSAPPAAATWHDANHPSCGCPPPPPCNPPVTSPPPAGQGLNPSPPLAPPSAANTPEPSTIVSALAMIGLAVAWRRRAG